MIYGSHAILYLRILNQIFLFLGTYVLSFSFFCISFGLILFFTRKQVLSNPTKVHCFIYIVKSKLKTNL
jgi:hypothetical protein